MKADQKRIKSTLTKVRGKVIRMAKFMKVSNTALSDIPFLETLISGAMDRIKDTPVGQFKVNIGQDGDDYRKNRHTIQISYKILKSYKPIKKR